MIKKNRKLVVISDLHIGGDAITDDFECEKELISFVNYLDSENKDIELLILGDFFDLWKVEEHSNNQVSYIINERKKLFNELKKFGEKHTITVIPGNHDHALAYNKKYQEQLNKYNINVDKNQFFMREFSNGKKTFRIIGEHGNQVEPGAAFPDFKMPTDSSLAYHFMKTFAYRIMKMGNEKKRPLWIKDVDNVDTELTPYWLLSKYFYHEIGPILRAVMIPMLLLFGLAVPYFIFDIVTDFYHPKFLEPILLFLDTNMFMKAIVFILYFDMVIVIILFYLNIIRNDIKKRLKEYGIQSLTEILISREEAYLKNAKEIFKGNNPFKVKPDLYVNGHTHIPAFNKKFQKNKIYVDTGSWKQLMKRMITHFRFPSVYVPYHSLNYLSCDFNQKEMNIQFRVWPKRFKPKLTILERLAIKKRRNIPKPFKKDTLIDEMTIKM